MSKNSWLHTLILKTLGLDKEAIEHILYEKVETSIKDTLKEVYTDSVIKDESKLEWIPQIRDTVKIHMQRYYREIMIQDVAMIFEEAKRQFLKEIQSDDFLSENYISQLSDNQIKNLLNLISKTIKERDGKEESKTP